MKYTLKLKNRYVTTELKHVLEYYGFNFEDMGGCWRPKHKFITIDVPSEKYLRYMLTQHGFTIYENKIDDKTLIIGK